MRYFAICAKLGWCHRLEVPLFEISVSLQWFKKQCSEIANKSVFKINTAYKSTILNQYFDIFLFGKIYFWNTWIFARNLRNVIQVCECTFCFLQTTQFRMKYLIHLRVKYLKTKAHYFRNNLFFFLMKHFYGIVFSDRNIDVNEKSFPPFQVRGNDVVMERSLERSHCISLTRFDFFIWFH